ncbi:unnamed protein product [Ceutorhynchus assimilis]|uniref:Methylenetetrahydrofolate reductase (NAD(P)H) n=1 Tax=Ceutorhynchus assimilis TaxID=467358 RepID=A0A9N9MTX9_9CUCU|nr:unnamed protein product [Ceutorhynchus assimilis]
MRELLLDNPNKTVEILPNKCGKNDFLKTILQSNQKISVELSPNHSFQCDILQRIRPTFVSITWLGNLHLDLPVEQIPAVILAKQFCDQNYSVLLHLTGRNLKKERMMKILEHLKEVGVKNILALQGDRRHILEPDDTKCDFPYASDLVMFIKKKFGDDFCVGVAGYPDVHPNNHNLEEDLNVLQCKVSNGAEFIVTQATFDFEALENFGLACRKHNINIPIIPGIFVIKSYQTLVAMQKYCEFKITKNVLDFVQENRDNDEVIANYGVDFAIDFIKRCLDRKELFSAVHMFSMNNIEDLEKVILRL